MKRVNLAAGVWRLRVEWCRFFLGCFEYLSEHFATAGLVNTNVLLAVQQSSGFKHVQSPNPYCFEGIDRLVIGDTDVTLGAQIVDFVGFDLEYEICQGLAISEVTIVQTKLASFVNIAVDMIDSLSRECAASANEAMHVVLLFNQQLRKVAAVLAGDACDECCFTHGAALQVVEI